MIYYDIVNEKYIHHEDLDVNKIIEEGYLKINEKEITDESKIIFYKYNNLNKYICLYKTDKISDIIIFINNSDNDLFEEEKIIFLINDNVYKNNKKFDYSIILNDVLSHLEIIFE